MAYWRGCDDLRLFHWGLQDKDFKTLGLSALGFLAF